MLDTTIAAATDDRAGTRTYDAIIIGAGIAGIYQLYRLRQLGLSVRVFETGGGVGGTWYWNRYPGARFDSESYTYGYAFSEELLREWNWSEHFAPQPETQRYLNHVVDRFDLRRDIQCNSRVMTCVFDETARRWEVTLESGERHGARFLITAVGPLSGDTLPRIAGIDSFKGRSFHTYRWPHEAVEFAGKRVAVIGTGATGVQVIQTIAPLVEQLTVFQRTSNWMANFRDMLTDPKANALFSEFVARKIRQRVKDPTVADKLIPKNHGFGTRRVPQETGYYEAYNLPHVRLVDMRETPVERVTETGIQTSDASYEFDLIIFATGFDAVTGSFDRIEFRGTGDQRLTEHWADGPKTLLGLLSAGFPNLLTIVGPHNASTRCNIPRCIEQNVDWITDLLRHARENKITRIEATPDAEADWSKHVEELASGMLYTLVDSWMTGINTNVDGRNVRRVLQYQGGAPAYRKRCDAIAAEGYSCMVLS
jgi:cation diffusion facilitator CzcD-associated flavoprotein CzcO